MQLQQQQQQPETCIRIPFSHIIKYIAGRDQNIIIALHKSVTHRNSSFLCVVYSWFIYIHYLVTFHLWQQYLYSHIRSGLLLKLVLTVNTWRREYLCFVFYEKSFCDAARFIESLICIKNFLSSLYFLYLWTGLSRQCRVDYFIIVIFINRTRKRTFWRMMGTHVRDIWTKQNIEIGQTLDESSPHKAPFSLNLCFTSQGI